MGYSIIGDDSASSFFAVTPLSGVVTLSNSVNDDTANVYRVKNKQMSHLNLKFVSLYLFLVSLCLFFICLVSLLILSYLSGGLESGLHIKLRKRDCVLCFYR